MVENLEVLKNASALIPKAWEIAKAMSKAAGDRASYDFRMAHQHYCTSLVKTFCRARTFFIRDEPKFLEDFYVPASIIKSQRTRVPQAGLNDLMRVARRTIVTGSGGSGKTIFMRHLLLDAIQQGERYPVFIELRALNDRADVSLEDLISNFMQDHGFPLGRELALRSLQEGLLVVLLDGFDEVVADKRKNLEKEIRRLGARSASQIVLSSRQDALLEGWDNFSTVCIAPLELEEACELIGKIPFQGDDEIKRRFAGRLKGGLFKSHQYFLSNPLLLSIMLLTYGDSADIPSKFSSFYEQAYSALYQKHDALKSGYRRERKVLLDIGDFSRLFAAFSAITYDKRLFRFSLVDGIKYVDGAKRITALSGVNSEGFLEDARQAVCLLIEDGLELSYVHRSFQEYFVAKFVNDAGEDVRRQYLAKLVAATDEGYQSENVLNLIYEMNPGLIEDHYLLPGLRTFFGASLGRKLSKAAWRALFMKLFSGVRLQEPESVSYSIKSRRALSLLLFLSRNCCGNLARSSGKDVYKELSGILGGVKDVALKQLPPRSPVWDVLHDDRMTFSYDNFEVFRRKVLEIERLSAERASAAQDIFQL